MTRTDLVEKLRETGLTQVELARRLGVSQAAVSFWFRGRRTPSWEVIRRMARAFPEMADDVIQVLLGDEDA